MPFIAPEAPDEMVKPPSGFVAPEPPDEEQAVPGIMGRIRRGEDTTPEEQKKAYDASDGFSLSSVLTGVGEMGKHLWNLAQKGHDYEMQKWQESGGNPVSFAAHQIPRMGRTLGEGIVQGTAGLGQMIRRPMQSLADTVAANAVDPGNVELKKQMWVDRVQRNAEEDRLLDPAMSGRESFVPGANPGLGALAGNFVDPSMVAGAAGPLARAAKLTRAAEVAAEAARTGGALRSAAAHAAPVVERVSEGAGRAAELASSGIDKAQLFADGAALVGGGVGPAAATHVAGRAASAALRWASRMRDSGTALRSIANADWRSAQPIYAQLAKDPNSPIWLKRAASTAIAPLVEESLRGASSVAEGAAKGAAIGAAAALDDTKTAEEKGAAVGQGLAMGAGGAAFGHATGGKARAEVGQAHDIAVRMQKAIDGGADPAVVLGASDAVMFYADNVEKLMRGAMPGGKDLKVTLADPAQFVAQGHPDGAVAVYGVDKDGNYYVSINLGAQNADARVLHETVGHALAESAVASQPAVLARVRAAVEEVSSGTSANLLQAASEQYARALRPDASPEELSAYIAEQQRASTERYQDPDAWILSELWAETAVRAIGGRSLLDLANPGLAGRAARFLRDRAPRVADKLEAFDVSRAGRKFDTATDTFFGPYISKVLDNPQLQDAVIGHIRELGTYRPGVDTPREGGIKVATSDFGKAPHASLHDLGGGQKGNDFVVQTANGQVVPRPAAQVRTISRNRRKYVDDSVPRNVAPAPVTDRDPFVRLRQTISGMVERSGTKLGDWFYNSTVFSETTKAAARRLEDAITNGETLGGWYHQIGESIPNWRGSVERDFGNLSAEFKDFVPINFLVTKVGNLIVRNYSLTSFQKKAQMWSSRGGPASLEIWNGDVGQFTKDVQTYLANHRDGRPGADGIGEQKRDVINAFLVGGNRTFEGKNPLRASLRGIDRNGIVRSYRLDRLEPVEKSAVTGFEQPRYESQVRNLSPAVPDSEEFKRWFGDSKIVDDSGKPLVVYHGSSDAEGFKSNRFSYAKKGVNEFTDADIGFFFGSKDVANAFGSEDGGAILPVYLKIDNPLEVSGGRYVRMLRSFKHSDWSKFKKAAVRSGHDGVVVRSDETGKNSEFSHQFQSDTYIAFDPKQIKSAVGNTGKFDPSNPDIRFSPATSPQNQVDTTATTQDTPAGHETSQENHLGRLPGSRFRVDPAVRGADFAAGIRKTKADHPFGAAVDDKGDQFYTDPKTALFLADDGLAGVAVTDYGDLVSVFKHPTSKANAKEILAEAAGVATTLDAFDVKGFLPTLYSQFGFRPVARVPFNKEFAPPGWRFDLAGEPDVVLMVKDPENILGIQAGDYNALRESVPAFADYDQAVAAQQAAKKRIASVAEPSQVQQGSRSSLKYLRQPPFEGRRNIRDIGRLLSRENAARGRLDLSKPEHRLEAATALAEEAFHALNKPDSGVEWYAQSIKQAMDEMSKLHPEFNHDPDAGNLFKVLVAITSNGSDVRTNLKNGNDLYGIWKSGFEIPTTRQLGGKASAGINEGLSRLNDLLKKDGIAKTIAFLNSEFTVGELKRAGYLISGESVKEKVRGSMIFGPKIGAFYTNLRGDFSPVTMDRWFMRTVGRITGTLSDISTSAIPGQVERLLNALKGKRVVGDFQVSEIRKQAIKLSREAKKGTLSSEAAQDSPEYAALRDFVESQHNASEKRGFKDGSEIETASKGLDINLSELQEAPENGSHRMNIRATVAEVQKILKGRGIEISNAALQAALWYHEKELVTRLGYRSAKGSDTVDYSTAARELVERLVGGRPQARQGAGDVRPVSGGAEPGAETSAGKADVGSG